MRRSVARQGLHRASEAKGLVLLPPKSWEALWLLVRVSKSETVTV